MKRQSKFLSLKIISKAGSEQSPFTNKHQMAEKSCFQSFLTKKESLSNQVFLHLTFLEKDIYKPLNITKRVSKKLFSSGLWGLNESKTDYEKNDGSRTFKAIETVLQS